MRQTKTRLKALAAAAVLLAAPAARPAEMIEAVAAQVGNDIVLLSEVQELTGPIEKRMNEAGVSQSEILMMRAEVLDRLIEQKLVAIVVARMEMQATPEEVDRAISSIAQDTGITTQQLIRSVTSHGLTLTEYREKIRSEIERSKVINGLVRSRVEVEEVEVTEAYQERFGSQPSGGEEVHLRHIVVAYGEQVLRDGNASCALAREGQKRVVAGEISFPALARDISSANAARGGDMGWIHVSDVAAWMSPTVDSLGSGGVSEVIEMPFGCNLIEVVERREFQPITFEQAAPHLQQEIVQRKTEQAFVTWIADIRADTYIERKGVFAETSRLVGGMSPETSSR
jgi:peptidyl-prolyl cis-trans isomerase SurA